MTQSYLIHTPLQPIGGNPGALGPEKSALATHAREKVLPVHQSLADLANFEKGGSLDIIPEWKIYEARLFVCNNNLFNVPTQQMKSIIIWSHGIDRLFRNHHGSWQHDLWIQGLPVLPGEGVDNLLLGALLSSYLQSLIFTDGHTSANENNISIEWTDNPFWLLNDDLKDRDFRP